MVLYRVFYIFFSCLSVLMLAAAFYFLYVQMPKSAWACSLFAVCATQWRIAVGGRVQRTMAFRLHLACSIPGFLCLTYLAFIATPSWLFIATSILYALTFVTGIPLWFEGIRKISKR